MKLLRILFICLAASLVTNTVYAQDEQKQKEVRKYLRKGNKQFRAGQREEASTNYLKANKTDATDPRTIYNLTTSLLPEQYWRPWPKTNDSLLVKEVARMDSCFHEAADRETNTIRKSQSYYNMGVMYQSLYQSKGQYQNLLKAIDAYKDVLRNNPNDQQARYNLVVCQKQLKDNPQNQQPPQNQQQNQEEKDEQQQQEKKDSTQQQQPPQQQQQQQQQPQPTMDKENIEQLLKAATQKEKDAQKRMQDMQQQGRPTNRKNW